MSWHRYDPVRRRLVLVLHVRPGAKASEVKGLHGEALKVTIAAPAVDNRANAAVIAFLSKALGVQRAAIAIRHGATSRRKTVEIAGGPELTAKVEALAAS